MWSPPSREVPVHVQYTFDYIKVLARSCEIIAISHNDMPDSSKWSHKADINVYRTMKHGIQHVRHFEIMYNHHVRVEVYLGYWYVYKRDGLYYSWSVQLRRRHREAVLLRFQGIQNAYITRIYCFPSRDKVWVLHGPAGGLLLSQCIIHYKKHNNFTCVQLAVLKNINMSKVK